MKDEEMAEQFANNGYALGCTKTPFESAKEAFLAGLKAGRPQWHDLRKDPTDLPENKRNVWCDFDYGRGKGYYDKNDEGWWIEGHLHCSTIDAWCEIPTFDKEE